MSDQKIIERFGMSRNADGIKCECGGYADSADVTDAEERRYGCGRPGCCSRAFVCAKCGARIVGTAEAPEME